MFVALPSDAPSAVVLPTTAVVEPGLGLGVVDEVHPAQTTAKASEMTTTKLAATVFFIVILPSYAISVRYPTRRTHLTVSICTRFWTFMAEKPGFHPIGVAKPRNSCTRRTDEAETERAWAKAKTTPGIVITSLTRSRWA
jgi:hypothetical protein